MPEPPGDDHVQVDVGIEDAFLIMRNALCDFGSVGAEDCGVSAANREQGFLFRIALAKHILHFLCHQ